MLFATASSSGFLDFLIFMGIGILCIRTLWRRYDNDGAVKDATKKGLINVIGRWLK